MNRNEKTRINKTQKEPKIIEKNKTKSIEQTRKEKKRQDRK